MHSLNTMNFLIQGVLWIPRNHWIPCIIWVTCILYIHLYSLSPMYSLNPMKSLNPMDFFKPSYILWIQYNIWIRCNLWFSLEDLLFMVYYRIVFDSVWYSSLKFSFFFLVESAFNYSQMDLLFNQTVLCCLIFGNYLRLRHIVPNIYVCDI